MKTEGPDFWKTTITITVLSEGKYDFDDDPFNLDTLRYEITEGECSGMVELTSEEKLTLEQVKQECIRHGTDREFFLWWEADGNEGRQK